MEMAARAKKKGSKPERGGKAVQQAASNSNLVQELLNIMDKYPTLDDTAAREILNTVRKRDDTTLISAKSFKGQEIHHLLGYAEMDRIINKLSIEDAVDFFKYLDDQGIQIGSSTGNLEDSGLLQKAHRAPGELGSAHMGTGGRLIKWPDDVDIPTDFKSARQAFETRVLPQAVLGSALGQFGDDPGKKYLETNLRNNAAFLKYAEDNGVDPEELINTIRQKNIDVTTGRANNNTRLMARFLNKESELVNTVSTQFNKAGNAAQALTKLEGMGILANGADTFKKLVNGGPQAISAEDFVDKTVEGLRAIPGQAREALRMYNNLPRPVKLGIKTLPILGSVPSALAVEQDQADYDKEIAANPKDKSLYISKASNFLAGWGDRGTVASFGLGSPLTEPISTGAGLAEIGVNGAREGVKLATNPAHRQHRRAQLQVLQDDTKQKNRDEENMSWRNNNALMMNQAFPVNGENLGI